MTLQQLRYVVTVAEKGTLSDAAKELFISQPALTKAIRELEDEMNISIFNRTNKGVIVSHEGDRFLGYARQVLEQTDLLEEQYKKGNNITRRFSVSTQHYSFAVNAFVDVIKKFGVSKRKSEIGILYTSGANKIVIEKMIKRNDLKFTELFTAKPHVFISSNHPLAKKKIINLKDLKDYPYLSFEQGDYNSFYFSEEILSTIDRDKNIKVRDRATLFNIAIGLDGYTVSTGIINKELNGENIIARPLKVNEYIKVGIITQKNIELSIYAKVYVEALKEHLKYTEIL